MGRLGASWGHLGAILGHPGAILSRLGAILGSLGPSWSHVEAVLGVPGAILGSLGAVLGFLGLSWRCHGPSQSVPERPRSSQSVPERPRASQKAIILSLLQYPRQGHFLSFLQVPILQVISCSFYKSQSRVLQLRLRFRGILGCPLMDRSSSMPHS